MRYYAYEMKNGIPILSERGRDNLDFAQQATVENTLIHKTDVSHTIGAVGVPAVEEGEEIEEVRIVNTRRSSTLQL